MNIHIYLSRRNRRQDPLSSPMAKIEDLDITGRGKFLILTEGENEINAGTS
jgi:hypothetical protein